MVKTIQDEAGEVCDAVGKEGHAAKRMRRLGTTGGWAAYIANVNDVIEDLTGHANEIARVVTAVANGDLETDDGRRRWRQGRARRVPAPRAHRQRHGRPARRSSAPR